MKAIGLSLLVCMATVTASASALTEDGVRPSAGERRDVALRIESQTDAEEAREMPTAGEAKSDEPGPMEKLPGRK